MRDLLTPSALTELLKLISLLIVTVMAFLNRKKLNSVDAKVNGRLDQLLATTALYETELRRLRSDPSAETPSLAPLGQQPPVTITDDVVQAHPDRRKKQ